MRKLLLIIISTLNLAVLYTQPINHLVGDVVMPAPNAAALGKYGDIPVSYATGVPDISIPIHVLQEGPLSLPVTLSYHAGGIRASETASWVGTGWSLSAGGLVTRITMGLPDERVNGYYNVGDELTLTDDNIIQAAGGSLDSEPDLFSFNIGSYAGKFLIDKAGKVWLFPKQDLAINCQYSSNEFKGFTILTPDGTKYIFGNLPSSSTNAGIEKTWIRQNTQPWETYTSTWFLVRIESADGNYQINFEYQNENYSYNDLASCNISYTFCTTMIGESASINSSCGGQYDPDIGKNINTTTIAGKRLHKITTSTDTVLFVPNTTARLDLDASLTTSTNTAYALKEIQLSNGTSDAPSFCTKWVFDYSYFEDRVSSGSNLNRSEYKRLKLDKFQQFSCDNSIQIPAYRFSYYGTTNSNGSTFLLNRLTKAIDHWGYPNGITDNDTKFVNIARDTVICASTRIEGSSDRKTYKESVKQGTLTRIIYPTGGATFLDLEPNSYFNPKQSIIERNLLAIENCQNTVNPPEEPEDVCCNSNYVFHTTSPLTAAQLANAKFTLQLEAVQNPPYPCGLYPVEIRIEAQRASDGYFIGGYEFNIHPDTAAINSKEEEHSLSFLEVNGVFQVNTAYKFTLYVTNGHGFFRLFYNDIVTTTNTEVGGLRIKSIISSTDTIISANDIVRSYRYVMAEDTSQSSGHLFTEPAYGYCASSPPIGDFAKEYIVFSAASIVPLSSYDGRHIVYERVEEDFNGNGSKIYTFWEEEDTQLGGFVFPMPPTQLRIREGKIKQETTVKENRDTVHILIQTPKDRIYQGVPGVIFRAGSFTVSCPSEGFIDNNNYFYRVYTPQTNAYQLAQTMETLDGVVTTTSYQYDNQDRVLAPTIIPR